MAAPETSTSEPTSQGPATLPEIPPSPFRAPSLRLRATAFVVGVILFVLLAADVHFDGALTDGDRSVGRWVEGEIPEETQHLFAEVLAVPGDDQIIFPVLFLGAAAVALLGRWRTGLLMAVSGLLTGLTVWTLKAFFAEDRPSIFFGDEELFVTSGAFPSGHATDTTVIVGLLVYFFAYTWVSRTRRDPRPLVVPLMLLWIVSSVAMGFFRVLGGVHWPTDIIGGWALGTAWLAATVTAHEVWVRPFEQLARGRRPLNEAVL